MRVVYRSIRKQIEKVIDAATRGGRTIDHIELTGIEAAELAGELSWLPEVKDGDHYMGVKIKVARGVF